MAELKFDAEMARVQRALAQCHDMTARRSAVIDALSLRAGERVVEVGCGGGFYAYETAQCVRANGHVCAVDISEDQIRAANDRCAEFPWVECRAGDVLSLSCEDSDFDAAYGVQVLEYVSDLDRALRELYRVLRPGGRVLILATNWSSVVWNSEQPGRMKQVLDGWAQHAPASDLSAILPSRMKAAGLAPRRQTVIPVLNMSYNQNAFSYWLARMVKAFVVSQNVLSETKAASWLIEFEDLEAKGSYFFCSAPILTEAMRIA